MTSCRPKDTISGLPAAEKAYKAYGELFIYAQVGFQGIWAKFEQADPGQKHSVCWHSCMLVKQIFFLFFRALPNIPVMVWIVL
jgi:hypothetical protein